MNKIRRNYTDKECSAAFIAYMAKKAAQYGMNSTYYANASGLTVDSYSTPQDALKLGIVAASNPKALDIWSTPDQTFSVKGVNARPLSVENNVISFFGAAIDSAGYTFLGGKGGRLLMEGYDRAGIILAEISGKPVVLSLMARGQEPYDNIDKSAKELCDMVAASLAGNTPLLGANLTALVSQGGGYAACIVPDVPGGGVINPVTPSMLIACKHSMSAFPTVSRRPASTTKVMTMLCALDYIVDEFESIFVKTADISGGSGSKFYCGDTITFHDALRIMMMESSNTLANTISRTIGERILASQNVTIPRKYLLEARIKSFARNHREHKWYQILGRIKRLVLKR